MFGQQKRSILCALFGYFPPYRFQCANQHEQISYRKILLQSKNWRLRHWLSSFEEKLFWKPWLIIGKRTSCWFLSKWFQLENSSSKKSYWTPFRNVTIVEKDIDDWKSLGCSDGNYVWISIQETTCPMSFGQKRSFSQMPDLRYRKTFYGRKIVDWGLRGRFPFDCFCRKLISTPKLKKTICSLSLVGF